MRVLCTTQPAHGHYRPLLPLVRALAARGHELRIGTSRRFTDVVKADRFDVVAVGLDWLEADKSTIPPDRKAPPSVTTIETFFAHQFVRMTAADLARDVIELADAWRPDLIIRETTEYGGLLAGQALGVPTAGVQVGSPSLMTPSVLAEVGRALDEARDRLGLALDPTGERLRREFIACFAPTALHDPTIPLPVGLATFRTADEARANPSILDGLGVDRPLVYVTLGTVFHTSFYDLPFFPAVLEGIRDLPVDVIVSIGPGADPSKLGPQPGHIRVAEYVPQRAVLGRSTLAICHGGYGTLLDAIDAAVPLVVVPFGADQYLNAASVVRLGIGSTLEEDDLRPATVHTAVERLLADAGARERIQRLRDLWHQAPGPDEAALACEDVATSAAS